MAGGWSLSFSISIVYPCVISASERRLGFIWVGGEGSRWEIEARFDRHCGGGRVDILCEVELDTGVIEYHLSWLYWRRSEQRRTRKKNEVMGRLKWEVLRRRPCAKTLAATTP